MQELLEIRLLGPFEVLAGGTLADVGGSKRQALLAMLALQQGRMVFGGRSSRPLRGTRSTTTSPASARLSGKGRSSASPTDMR
jgi:hypothetical protein